MSLMLPTPLNRKRWPIVVSLVVVALLVLTGTELHKALSSPPRFRASTVVQMTPFTNGVMTASFQAQTFQSMPGVHLKQRGAAGLIEVVAYGPTAAAALTNANQATYRLLLAAPETFGTAVRVRIVRGAVYLGRTSIFHQ
jgi:hypothetical protein